MANITEISEDRLKLNKETEALLAFNDKMELFFPFFHSRDEALNIELDNFADKLDIFTKPLKNFVKELLSIDTSIKKASKKPSTTLRDIASLTQRIGTLIQRGKILNEKAEILFDESETIKERYLAKVKK